MWYSLLISFNVLPLRYHHGKKQNSLLNMFSISAMFFCFDASTVCKQVCMSIWQSLRNIISIWKTAKVQIQTVGDSAVDGPSFRSEKMVNETTKKLYLWNKKGIFFFPLSEKLMHVIFLNKILWPKMSKSFWRLIKCKYAFHFSTV